MGMGGNVVKLHGGADMRASSLTEALLKLIYERSEGMPFPTVVGCLRIAEHRLMIEQMEDAPLPSPGS